MENSHAENEDRSREVLRMLRNSNIQKEVSRQIGRLVNLPETAVLLAFMCEYAGRVDQSRLLLACAEALEADVRILRGANETSSASHRSEEQRVSEHSDVVQTMSRLLAFYGKAAWIDGSWENATPRIANGVAHRVDRLRAIGNGQVPAVAARAFEYLYTQLNLVINK